DRIRRTGQLGNIHIVAIVTNVDSTGSNVRHFQYIGPRHFILDTQIVLADQRRLNMVVVGRIKVRAGQAVEIVPPGQQSQGPVLEHALQTCDVLLQSESIGVRSPFLNSMNHAVDADAVVENARAPAYDKAATPRGLPRHAYPGSEITQG